MNLYETVLKKNNITPNFFISERYWELKNWEVKWVGDDLGVWDSDGNIIFPRWNKKQKRFLVDKFEIGFPGLEGSSFFDYQFVYDSRNFFQCAGKRFHSHRKMLKRVVLELNEDLILVDWDKEKSIKFLENWILEREGDEWYDLEAVLESFITYPEDLKKIIIGEKFREIYGIVNFDFSYHYLNFRNCLTKKDIPGLQNIARQLFYVFAAKNYIKFFLVNDGGSLGSEGLYNFKKRLNPIRIYSIHEKNG